MFPNTKTRNGRIQFLIESWIGTAGSTNKVDISVIKRNTENLFRKLIQLSFIASVITKTELS